MAFDTILDADILMNKPANEQLMKALNNRDNYIYDEDVNGNAQLLITRFSTGHTHDGTAGQGQPIPAAGIDTSGIWKAEYIDALAISNGKIKNTTIQTNDFADGAVSYTNLNGDGASGMGTAQFSGSLDPVTLDATVNHGLGKRPVVTNFMTGYIGVLWTTSSQCKLFSTSIVFTAYNVAFC